jgi:hypothetical protein
VSGVRDARPPFGLERKICFIRLPRVPDTAAVPPTSRDHTSGGLAAPDVSGLHPWPEPRSGECLPPPDRLCPTVPGSRIGPRADPAAGQPCRNRGRSPTFGRRPPPAPLPLGAPHHGRERRMYRTIFLQLSRGEAGRAHGLRTWARPCREAAPPASPRSLIGEARSGREAPRGSFLVLARHDRASMRRRSASPRNHSPATARAR